MVRQLVERVSHKSTSQDYADPSWQRLVGDGYHQPGSATYERILHELATLAFERQIKHPVSLEEVKRKERIYLLTDFQTYAQRDAARRQLDYELGKLNFVEIREVIDQKLQQKMANRREGIASVVQN